VYVTGDFDDWKQNVNKMEQKTDGTFFKHVELPNYLGTKIRYTFIVDGQMMPDLDKTIESDGNGTAVNVLTRTLRIPQLPTGTTTRNLTAAFNAQYKEVRTRCYLAGRSHLVPRRRVSYRCCDTVD